MSDLSSFTLSELYAEITRRKRERSRRSGQVCAYPGCDAPEERKGFCCKHYFREYRKKTLDPPQQSDV